MNADSSNIEFFSELESSLFGSNMSQRKIWVAHIVQNDIDLKELSGLLRCEQKIAIRFLWLLSEVGMSDPDRLFAELPYLLNVCEQLNPAYKKSFASFWLIAGVPAENEAQAIDLLFEWFLSAEVNVTIKARSFLVLFKLTEKYPELKNELKLCLIDQMDKYTKDFRKRAEKILAKLEMGDTKSIK